jgi:Phage integrase family
MLRRAITSVPCASAAAKCRVGFQAARTFVLNAMAPAGGVFIIPGTFVKNGDERPSVLNRIAKSVVEAHRGISPAYIFMCKGKPITRRMTAAWKRARIRAELPQMRVHDLKHTFGRRLRAAGVSIEDRQDLLGHRSARITTHYSAAELSRLIAAANRVCGRSTRQVELVVLRGSIPLESRKTPARSLPEPRPSAPARRAERHAVASAGLRQTLVGE